MTGPRPCQTRGREGQNTSITLWGVALGHVPGPAPARHRANQRGPRAAAGSAPPGAARGRCAAGPRARACRIGIMCGMWRDLLRAADDFRIVSGYRRYDTGGCECDCPDADVFTLQGLHVCTLRHVPASVRVRLRVAG